MEKPLQALAGQLRCPEGEDGIRLGQNMYMTNLSLILNGIANLHIHDNDHILELGYGNGGLLGYILSLAENLRYTGLEISPTMHREALTLNQAYLHAGLAQYYLYDGVALPFSNPLFNRILSVNTIYFWERPTILFKNICRVLKEDGLLCLTFCDQAFMQKLPFTQYGFQLYDAKAVRLLASGLPLKLIHEDYRKDKAVNKLGLLVNREFMSLIWQKTA